MYRVLLERAAEKDLTHLAAQIHDRIIIVIQTLAQNPRPPGCRKLAGSKNDYGAALGWGVCIVGVFASWPQVNAIAQGMGMPFPPVFA